jgi:hypothetical protein
VRDGTGLANVLLEHKLAQCPHCRQTGALIGHGLLRGYAERSSERVVRGRRIFCSNRGLRPGCGRTFSVLLTMVLSGFLVRTLTLFCFVTAVLGGLTRRAAWLREAQGVLSLCIRPVLPRQLLLDVDIPKAAGDRLPGLVGGTRIYRVRRATDRAKGRRCAHWANCRRAWRRHPAGSQRAAHHINRS